MITITNKKMRGFEPCWAPFKGFSLLFDNLGNGFSTINENSKLVKLNCSVDTDPNLKLYKVLASALDQIGRNTLTNTYLFGPLPSYSYHVTVWDGINDDNILSVPDTSDRTQIERFLNTLPASFLQSNQSNNFLSQIRESGLVKTNWEICFEFDKLVKWGNSMLVACLKPADQTSTILEEIKKRREELYNKFQGSSGIHITIPHWEYSPHVSLGYFANQELAELATPHINLWDSVIRKEIRRIADTEGNPTIKFNRISLYGFTDMATFFKESCLSNPAKAMESETQGKDWLQQADDLRARIYARLGGYAGDSVKELREIREARVKGER